MRVYLPATLPLLRQWLAAGTAEPAVVTAVTPRLRESYREGDTEELEWVAQQVAARLSLRLLAADPAAGSVRAVLAADVADGEVMTIPDADSPAEVRLAGAVQRDRWASVLLDDRSREDDGAVVERAARLIRSGGPSDQAGQDALEDADAVELGWWGIQELPGLLAGKDG